MRRGSWIVLVACFVMACSGNDDTAEDGTSDGTAASDTTAVADGADPGDDVALEQDFSADDGSWTITGDGDLVSEAELTDGALSAVDDVVGGVWYFTAPDEVVSEVSRDAVISFDLRWDSTSECCFPDMDLAIGSADMAAYLVFDEPPTAEWTTYSIDLRTATWYAGTLADNGRPSPFYSNSPTLESIAEADLDAIFASLETFMIRGEYIVGDDTGYLDNFSIQTP